MAVHEEDVRRICAEIYAAGLPNIVHGTVLRWSEPNISFPEVAIYSSGLQRWILLGGGSMTTEELIEHFNNISASGLAAAASWQEV